MKHDLYLDEFVINSIEADGNTIYYNIVPQYEGIYKCPYCGSHYLIKDGRYCRTIRDLPSKGRFVVLKLYLHIYRCTRCNKPVRMHFNSILERSRLTGRLRAHILSDYDKLQNAYKVADKYGVSEGLIRKMIKVRDND